MLCGRMLKQRAECGAMEQPLLGGPPPGGRCGAPPGGRRWYCALRSWLPVLSWLPRYSLSALRMDVVAGLTVGLTTVPQALAYAEVAGLPVQYGLYSAFMGGFIYPLLGTSKDLTLGPTAIMSLLCASVVGGRPGRAVLLSLLCGAVQTAMGLLRLGFLLDFVSYPVIKGFTCAAAVTIGFGQIKVPDAPVSEEAFSLGRPRPPRTPLSPRSGEQYQQLMELLRKQHQKCRGYCKQFTQIGNLAETLK
ncbi:unnamed protein product [Arctogadus glacialis]